MPNSNKNVTNATTAGVGVGVGGGVVMTYAASLIHAKYGVPLEVSAAVIGSALGFLTRWAAKLNPHE